MKIVIAGVMWPKRALWPIGLLIFILTSSSCQQKRTSVWRFGTTFTPTHHLFIFIREVFNFWTYPRYTFVVLCKIYIALKFFAKTIHGRPSYVRNWQVCNDVLGLSDSLSASQVTSTWDESGNIRYSFVFFL